MAAEPTAVSGSIEAQVREDLIRFSRKPLQYALWNWPNADLRQWQVEWLADIEGQLADEPYMPIQTARASGHGVGKSAGIAILCNWAIETCEFARGVVTANTDTQLRTKTWPEVTKWHDTSLVTRVLNEFKCTATALHHAKHERTWRIDAVPWSEHNTEAFAGMHNKGRRIIVCFDEASKIADKVWEVTEGALTDEDTEIIWAVKGNPTRTEGRFRACFGSAAHRWRAAQIDSRTVPGTNKAQIQKWIEDHGEDSDFVRVRVRGVFPRASSQQFIESDIVAQAKQRAPIGGLRDPLIMGVDVARGGADNYVISYRRGLDAKSIPWVVIPGSEARNSERLIAKVVDLATTQDRFKRPDAVFVDETGLGGPIVDRLRNLLGDSFQVMGVQFGSASPRTGLANMRTFIWWQMREALRVGLAIPDDAALEAELTAVEVAGHDRSDRLVLESKEDMRDRLPDLGSPDRADALAVTFAYNVQPREQTEVRMGSRGNMAQTDYDPWARQLGGQSMTQTDYDPWR